MKKIFLYTLLVIIAGVGCRKKDNPRIPDFTRVPQPQITKDAGSAFSISGLAPNTFTGNFTVDLFFKSDIKPSKLDIVVIKNGDKSIIKSIQANITSFPAKLTVTGLQLATLFGTPIVLGDKFDIGADVTTQAGEKFDAFPLAAPAYDAGVTAQAGATPTITYTCVCPFDINDYAGNFKVTIDDWNDFGIGTIIPVTKVNDKQLSFISPVNNLPIKIDIDPASLVTAVASQSYGDYKAAGIDPTWTYGNANIVSVNSASNAIDPCNKVVSIAVIYTVSAGQFTNSGAPFILAMKKQ